MSEFPDSDAILAQFNLLMGELLQGGMRRGKFRPWEIDILLDIESCTLRGAARREVLCEYQNAAQAELQQGAHLPMRFSEYLERRQRSRAQRKPAEGASRAPIKPKTRVR
jgi:hypothetical protein